MERKRQPNVGNLTILLSEAISVTQKHDGQVIINGEAKKVSEISLKPD